MKSKKKQKILVVFGTRPEAIKMLPLVKKLKQLKNTFDVKTCVSAQHRHMLDQMLNFFEIIPDYDLNVMRPNHNLVNLTSLILKKFNNVLKKFKPNLILVHGDTTTTLATAMTGFYNGYKVGHVEAGLRTNDILSPYPEEFNRQIVTKIADLHFAPTKLAKKNLISEKVSKEKIQVTGNTVIDAMYWTLHKLNKKKNKKKIINELNTVLKFNWQNKKFVLITGHRRENFGDGISQISKAIFQLALKYPKIYFVYPVHLNPNVIKPVHKILKGVENVLLIKPLDYEKFIYIMKYAYLILTDSGGIQEEAPSLGKPVLVTREITERPEAIKAGTVKLIGNNQKKIIQGVSKLLNDKRYYKKMSKSLNPYGDGLACDRIIKYLKKCLF